MSVDFTALAVPADETRAFPIEHLESVNVNSGNGRTLLTMLGLWDASAPEDSWCGECPAAEFVERATVAAAVDPGTPTPGFTDGNWHEVGSPAAHVAMRLAELADLALAADQVPDAVIVWS